MIGNAYLTGVLEAIRRVSGWDAGDAEVVVGPSAGSVNGAMLASGLPPWAMYGHATGDEIDAPHEVADPRLAQLLERFAEHSDREWTDRLYPLARGVPRPLLSSPAAILRGVSRPWSTPLATFVCGLLGEGLFSTRVIGEIIKLLCPDAWPDRRFWAVTVDLETSRRVVFGRDGAPPTTLSRAVRASCAIPAFFSPVRIDGHRYVDGGVWSVSNLDLVASEDLDLVVCVNPMSGLEGRSFEGPVDRFTGMVHRLEQGSRARLSGRIDTERSRVERSGTPVLLIEPTAADLEVIPLNLMNAAERKQVARRALETTIATFETRRHTWSALAMLRGSPAHGPRATQSRGATPAASSSSSKEAASS